jgi:hypothetical protein
MAILIQKEKQGLKKCPKCDKIKKVNEFRKNKSARNGLSSQCKACDNQSSAKYRTSDKGKRKISKYRKSEKGKEAAKRGSKKQMAVRPHRVWATQTLSNHRKRGNEIQITPSKLEMLAKQSTHCQFCGCELAWGYGNGYVLNSPSLDRINNDNTISVDNVQILCIKCNTSKQDRTMDELVSWCKMVVTKFEKQN